MRRLPSSVLAMTLILLGCAAVALAMTLPQKKSHISHKPALMRGCEGPSQAAIKVLDDFMDGFNAKDIRKFEATYNFPHVRLANGRVTTLEGPSNQQQIFEGLEKNISWDYSRYDDRKIIQCGPDKVHVAVRVTRYRKDNTPIHTFDSLYVVRVGSLKTAMLL
ncbi:MAG: hypothetical protein ABI882_24295, partial [Acidobacteriota bacterium]